jgi:hypothetical protein
VRPGGCVTAGEGHRFEPLCKWFLENVWLYLAQPNKSFVEWRAWTLGSQYRPRLGLYSGADELCAFQAKSYGPKPIAAKAGTNIFPNDLSRELFKLQLWTARTDCPSMDEKPTLASHIVLVQALLRPYLLPAGLKNSRSVSPAAYQRRN